MNSKHLLVKSITLLYQESNLPNNSSLSNSLVSKIVEHIKLPEVSMGMDLERAVLKNLIQTVKRMLRASADQPLDYTELMQQIIIDCADDNATIDAIKAGIEVTLDEQQAQNLCNSIRRQLQQFLRDEEAKEIIYEFSNKLRFNPEQVGDLTQELFKFNSLLEPYYSGTNSEDPAIVASFGLSDSDAVDEVYNRIKDRSEGLGGFRFGWQDWNRMFKGTVERGKMMVLGGLQHQHKSGVTRAIIRHLAMYNIPDVKEFECDDSTDVKKITNESNYLPIIDEDLEDQSVSFELAEIDTEDFSDMYNGILWKDEFEYIPSDIGSNDFDNTKVEIDEERFVYYLDPFSQTKVPVMALKDPFNGKKPKRKPTLVYISTEDEIEDIMEQFYSATYFNVEKKAADLTAVSPSQMREYVQYHLSRNGWHVHIMRVNPSEWTYHNVCQVVLDLESKGCEVHAMAVDYLPMIPTTGCTEGPAGYALRDMYRRVRNFMSARDIFFITPHQLSSDAMRLLRQGVDDFVKNLPDRNYYADSTQISHEVDIEVFFHIEKENDTSWLTCQRGKYRSTKIIEDKYKYTAMPFHPEGGLQDDLLGVRLSRNSVGGTISSDGSEEAPMWSFS